MDTTRLLHTGKRPPIRHCPLTWKQLYAAGCFFQRELINASGLQRMARDRAWPFAGLGRERWERRDKAGALRPIAFGQAPYFSGMTSPAIPVEELVFREASEDYRPWEEFSVEIHGYPEILEKYTPWQVLTLSEVLDAESRKGWDELAADWEPVTKVLVRLQRGCPVARRS